MRMFQVGQKVAAMKKLGSFACCTMLLGSLAGCGTVDKLVRVQGYVVSAKSDCQLFVTKPSFSYPGRSISGAFNLDYVFSPKDSWADVDVRCGGNSILRRRFEPVTGKMVVGDLGDVATP